MFESDTKSIQHEHTLSAQRRLIKKHRMFHNGIGVEPQDYGYFLNTVVP